MKWAVTKKHPLVISMSSKCLISPKKTSKKECVQFLPPIAVRIQKMEAA